MKKGYTLLEMLFVLIILSILTAIAIPNITKQNSSKSVQTMKNDILSLKFNIENSFIEKGVLPATNGDLKDEDNNGFADTQIDSKNIIISKNNFLSYENKSETGEKCYILKAISSNTTYKFVFDSCLDSAIHSF